MSRFRWNTEKIVSVILRARPNAAIVIPDYTAAAGSSRTVVCLIGPFDAFSPLNEQKCLYLEGSSLDQEEVFADPDNADVDRVDIFGDYYFDMDRESEDPDVQALREAFAKALEAKGAVIGTAADDNWDADKER